MKITGQDLRDALLEYYQRRHPAADGVSISGSLVFMTMLSPGQVVGEVEIKGCVACDLTTTRTSED